MHNLWCPAAFDSEDEMTAQAGSIVVEYDQLARELVRTDRQLAYVLLVHVHATARERTGAHLNMV